MTEKQVLEILAKTGAVITGSHAVYTSGKHGSAYVNKDAVYPHTYEISKLCQGIAEAFGIDETTGEIVDGGIEVVVGPAIGGIVLSQWTANHLSDLLGREVLALFAEKDEKSVFKASEEYFLLVAKELPGGKGCLVKEQLSQGQEVVIRREGFVFKRGYDKLLVDSEEMRGKKVLVVEDVLTTGGSVKKVIEAVRRGRR
jgi:orotate phosphoribosyltransferase